MYCIIHHIILNGTIANLGLIFIGTLTIYVYKYGHVINFSNIVNRFSYFGYFIRSDRSFLTKLRFAFCNTILSSTAKFCIFHILSYSSLALSYFFLEFLYQIMCSLKFVTRFADVVLKIVDGF